MKNYLLLLALLTIQFSISAQDYPKSKIGASVSLLGNNDIANIGRPLDGAGSNDGKGFYNIGIDYLYSRKKWLDIESGLEYSHHKYEISSHDLPQQIVTKKEFSLLTIPFAARVNFLRFFFVKAGVMADVDLNSEFSLGGLGLIGGVGVKYDFKNGSSVYVNPYSKLHSLLRFTNNNGGYRLWESGFRFGFYYPMKF